ncbi:hypothetical protein X992_5605 [Burkholderia pseudomallei MSHR5492]|nr:hypothetical protein X992_5605 [Burkholderia pseudomallei MSHR5492]
MSVFVGCLRDDKRLFAQSHHHALIGQLRRRILEHERLVGRAHHKIRAVALQLRIGRQAGKHDLIAAIHSCDGECLQCRGRNLTGSYQQHLRIHLQFSYSSRGQNPRTSTENPCADSGTHKRLPH